MNLKQLFSVLWQQRWLVAGLTLLGMGFGVGWRWLNPVPTQASMQLPVVIRNRQENPMWNETVTDALYTAVFQIIDENKPQGLVPSHDAYLVLTEETFLLTVRAQSTQTAIDLVTLWAEDAFRHITELASASDNAAKVTILAGCIAQSAENTDYTCEIIEISGEQNSEQENNMGYSGLWVGEPENLTLQDSSLMNDYATASVSGAVMGLMAAFFIVFLQISRTGTINEP